MREIRKYYRRFLVWLGIMKTKPEKEILKALKKGLKVEEQQECDHKILSALFPNDIWYRCTKCNMLWIMTDAMVVKADKLPELIKKLQMVAGIKPKNKEVMSLKEFKKRRKKQVSK